MRTYTQNWESKREKSRFYYLPDVKVGEHIVYKPSFQAIFQVSAGRLGRLLRHKSVRTPSPCDKRQQKKIMQKNVLYQKNSLLWVLLYQREQQPQEISFSRFDTRSNVSVIGRREKGFSIVFCFSENLQ